MTYEIPEEIKDVLSDDEIENFTNRTGWAVGTVVKVNSDGTVVNEYRNCMIELLNGEGLAGEFGGVRVYTAESTNDFHEFYAYPEKRIAEENAEAPYCYVREFQNKDVDVGIASP